MKKMKTIFQNRAIHLDFLIGCADGFLFVGMTGANARLEKSITQMMHCFD